MILETYILEIINGRRKGRPLLRALSYLYRSGVALRNAAYDSGFFKAYESGLPVVSIGNIVAGGTGKTPLIKFLAEELLKICRVAILSRGYRSTTENSGKTLQATANSNPILCGDEPLWLAQQLPHAQVWVGKDRRRSAQQAKEEGAAILLLDDGMQHRQLKRDFEIVLVNGEDPLGKGFFLPRGLLRDSPSRLSKADLIVVNEPENEKAVEQQLHQYTDAPVVFSQMRTSLSLQGKKVGVFCAIARPHRFLKTIQAAGGEAVATLFKPDHAPFSPAEIAKFAESCAADLLVCTEKDWVKLPADLSCRLPVIPLPGKLEIVGNLAAWERLLNKIKSRVSYDRRIPSDTP